jgi:hypothetical protein
MPTAPLLVTGLPRSGTSWTGKMLEASGQVVYVNEPMSTKRPPGGSPGVLNATVHHKFQYVDPQADAEWRRAFADTLRLRFRPGAEIAAVRSPYHLARGAKYAAAFTMGALRGKVAMLDDPNALFSAPWLTETMGVRTVVVVRDPVGMIGSWRQLGWKPDLGEWLAQPALMRDHLEGDRELIERAHASGDWLEQMICLWTVGNRFVDGLRDRDGISIWRYEDLAHDPLDRYEALYRWCGLDWSVAASDAIREATTASGDQHRGFAWTLKGGISRTAFRRMDSRAAVSQQDRRLDPDEIERVRSATGDVLERFPRTTGA